MNHQPSHQPSHPHATNPPPARATSATIWADRVRTVRAATLACAAPLSAEDQQVQSMPDASPAKWHLAHGTWFFETFLLRPHLPGYTIHDPRFDRLFNSYYDTIGARTPRHQRGLITRPTLADVHAYRTRTDAHLQRLIAQAPDALWPTLRPLLSLGLNHEQQHQELLLMDIKHLLSCNPLQPAYAPPPTSTTSSQAPPTESWTTHPGGLITIGHTPDPQDPDQFAFDNEGPPHRVWLEPFRLANQLVTCAQYQRFIADGGYGNPRLWLSDGWATVQREAWQAPLYWIPHPPNAVFTLHGPQPLAPHEPVVHVSYYEADAYARWAGHRLPTEAEWEAVQSAAPPPAAHSNPIRLHPAPIPDAPGPQQMTGAVWQFTASPYTAYPGFRPDPGAVGEYNGKFMVNQMVLRGSACITPAGHHRTSYRNFFPPGARWMFGGIRLAS